MSVPEYENYTAYSYKLSSLTSIRDLHTQPKKRWDGNHARPNFVFLTVCTVHIHTWCQGWLRHGLFTLIVGSPKLCVASELLCCKSHARGNVTFYSALFWWQIMRTWTLGFRYNEKDGFQTLCGCMCGTIEGVTRCLGCMWTYRWTLSWALS